MLISKSAKQIKQKTIFLNDNTKNLRQSLRRRRRQLGVGSQITSARRLAEVITSQTIYSASRHIAFYLASDGEISLWPLLKKYGVEYDEQYVWD